MAREPATTQAKGKYTGFCWPILYPSRRLACKPERGERAECLVISGFLITYNAASLPWGSDAAGAAVGVPWVGSCPVARICRYCGSSYRIFWSACGHSCVFQSTMPSGAMVRRGDTYFPWRVCWSNSHRRILWLCSLLRLLPPRQPRYLPCRGLLCLRQRASRCTPAKLACGRRREYRYYV